MKVLLINGSPHGKGSTYTALNEVAVTLDKEGIETARCHNVEELEAVFNKIPVLS